MSNQDRYIRTTDFPAFYRLLRMRWNRWRHMREPYLEPTVFRSGDRVVAHPLFAARTRAIYEAEGFTPNRKTRRAAKATGKQIPAGYVGGLPVVESPMAMKACWRWVPRFKLWRFHL